MMSAWTVSELAGHELGLGRPERGALLVGAADRALDILGVTRQTGDRLEHERVVTKIRGALGEEAFESLYAQGGELSLAEAVALALSEEGGGGPGNRGAGEPTGVRAGVAATAQRV